jgi:hypothetical protein
VLYLFAKLYREGKDSPDPVARLFGGMDIKKPADEEWPSYDDNGTGRVDYLPELS